MIQEKMLSNLEEYKDMYSMLKDEFKKLKSQERKIEKAKKYLDKLGTSYIQLEDIEQVPVEEIETLDKEIKLCKSIIRRYETLLGLKESE